MPAGLAARELAHRLIDGVLAKRRPLDDLLAAAWSRADVTAMEARDRAFARVLTMTVLRRLGTLEHVLAQFLKQPLRGDALRVRPVLLAGAAQLLCLQAQPHAVVDLAVAATHRLRNGTRYAGLVNAVLRRVAADGADVVSRHPDPLQLDVPSWLWSRWAAAYGADKGRRIAEASLAEAALDITVKPGEDVNAWAKLLAASQLATGSVRLEHSGRIEDLAGYADGGWWVQDAAAALVARIAGSVVGKTVADLCAAPGGKTAMLVALGAQVTAVDVSARRLERLAANLQRLRLKAEQVAADAATWNPGRLFDVVVLDAPCSATGTIRRHPDILHLKGTEDVARTASLQRTLLDNAARLVRPGGTLVYATCSLEPEEGEQQIAGFLDRARNFEQSRIDVSEVGGVAEWSGAGGALRTLPFHTPSHVPPTVESPAGMDGFYIARLRRFA